MNVVGELYGSVEVPNPPETFALIMLPDAYAPREKEDGPRAFRRQCNPNSKYPRKSCILLFGRS